MTLALENLTLILRIKNLDKCQQLRAARSSPSEEQFTFPTDYIRQTNRSKQLVAIAQKINTVDGVGKKNDKKVNTSCYFVYVFLLPSKCCVTRSEGGLNVKLARSAMGDGVHMMIRPSAVASRRFGGPVDRLASPRLACAKPIASIDGPVMELERE
ncbi:hypothetical protein TNCV_1618061 [Trichonephila clavipes]|nr:hypothetical protein TNCV_1618061 [Trichonephila clavipes]